MNTSSPDTDTNVLPLRRWRRWLIPFLILTFALCVCSPCLVIIVIILPFPL